MAAKSASVVTSTTTTYAATPEFDAGFLPNGIEMYLTGTAVVAFSYDGANDHGRLDSVKFNSSARASKYQKVWLRAVSGGPATVLVSAWT